MTDKRARLAEINRDWGWWTPEARNGARVWMTVELEAAWAEGGRLRLYCEVIDNRAEAAEQRVSELEAELATNLRDLQQTTSCGDSVTRSIDGKSPLRVAEELYRGTLEMAEEVMKNAIARAEAAEKRVKVLEEALNSMVRVASCGHVPDDVFDAMARIRSAALEESPKQMKEAEK